MSYFATSLLCCVATLLHRYFATLLLRYFAASLLCCVAAGPSEVQTLNMEPGGCRSRMRLTLVTFDGSLAHQPQRVFVRIKTCCLFQLCSVVREHLYIASKFKFYLLVLFNLDVKAEVQKLGLTRSCEPQKRRNTRVKLLINQTALKPHQWVIKAKIYIFHIVVNTPL